MKPRYIHYKSNFRSERRSNASTLIRHRQTFNKPEVVKLVDHRVLFVGLFPSQGSTTETKRFPYFTFTSNFSFFLFFFFFSISSSSTIHSFKIKNFNRSDDSTKPYFFSRSILFFSSSSSSPLPPILSKQTLLNFRPSVINI